MKPIYLDCNATTPIEDEVRDIMTRYLASEYGNAGSRTHVFGQEANKAVEDARRQVAEVVSAEKDEVIFTSGATESNNIAILGLQKFAIESGKNHIISSSIEHKAVLEPLEYLSKNGFEITLIDVDESGVVDPKNIEAAIEKNTLMVSLMHVNNELGTIQPIDEIANFLTDTDIIFHVDAAQGFGKDISPLQNKGIDLISISGHKIYGPKGIGALIKRKRKQLDLNPLMLGGGQERGIRPGTLPVHLIAGLGLSSELAYEHHEERNSMNKTFKEKLLSELKPLNPRIHGNQDSCLDNVISMSFDQIDSEALMLVLKNEIAISNGSACTSSSYEPSHVMTAIGLDDDEAEYVTRWSWCHMSLVPDWMTIIESIKSLKS